MDVFALIISFVALLATLRKKEFGKFVLITNANPKGDIRIRSIKSDLFECKFKFEPLPDVPSRMDIKYPNEEKFKPFESINKSTYSLEIGFIPSNAILKFVNGSLNNITITYCDKYGNWYSQKISNSKINRRYHKNFWNLTFAGT